MKTAFVSFVLGAGLLMVACSDDSTEASQVAGTGGSADASASGGAAGESPDSSAAGGSAGQAGASGGGPDGSADVAAVDAPLDVKPEAAGPCPTKLWTVGKSCTGTGLVASAVVETGALVLTSEGIPDNCDPTQGETDIAVSQTPLEGDFTIEIAYSDFSGPASTTAQGTFIATVASSLEVGMAAAVFPTGDGANMWWVSVPKEGGGSTDATLLTLETSGKLTFSRVGDQLKAASGGASLTWTGPTSPMTVALGLRGPRDASLAKVATSVRVQDFKATSGNSVVVSDTFDCDSLKP